jgi:hypothetical protein
MELSDRQLAIIKAISHFDVLDYPLALTEIVYFCGRPLTLSEVWHLLDSEPLNLIIEQRHGFYFLKGRQDILKSRHNRYRLALKKLRRAQLASALLRHLPWVRAVAIYSSLSLKNSRQQGDIDLFFITATDRIWSARFFINALLSILHLRPTKTNSQDKLCTSYFISEAQLDLSAFNDFDDYYYAYGVAAFNFLAGDSRLIADFFHANSWIKNFLPNWQPIKNSFYRPESKIFLNWQKFSETILGLFSEETAHQWQLKILPQKYQMNQDGKIIVLSATAIKTHDNDKRRKFNKLFTANFQKITVDYEKNN